MQVNPFHHSRSFALLVEQCFALPVHMQAEAFASIGEYVSRGHGRNVRVARNKVNSSTDWALKLGGQTCGKRECARRVNQMQKAG